MDWSASNICERRTTFEDKDCDKRLIIECQAQNMTDEELRSHRNTCPCRTGNQSFEDGNIDSFAKLLWQFAKKSNAAKALINHINSDLSKESLADHGISKLRTNVAVSNIDVYTLDGYVNYHCVHNNPSHISRRRKSIEVALSFTDLKLLAGAGSSVNNIKKMVKNLHSCDIPIPKNVVDTVRSERKEMRDFIEIVTISNVARRNKNSRGLSHLVRFKNSSLMEYLNRYIYDKDGVIRKFVQDSHSISLSSDHGKGSLKLAMHFNCENTTISSYESIILGLAKCQEDEVSMNLMMESCWPILIQSFASSIDKPLFLTGDHKNISVLLGIGSGASEHFCPYCHVGRQTKIDPTANPADESSGLKSDRVKYLTNFDEFYGDVTESSKRKLSDWTNPSTADNKSSIKKLKPMNPLLFELIKNSKFDLIEDFIPPPALHFKLVFNKIYEYSTAPSKWIHNFHLKSKTGTLSQKEKDLFVNTKVIERMVTEIKPRRHGPTGQLDAHWTGPDIDTILKKSETVLKALQRQAIEENADLTHAIGFFQITTNMDKLCHAICGKKLAQDWKQKLNDFRECTIAYLRNCQHIGCYYIHALTHISDIISKQKVALGLIGNDQVQAKHHFHLGIIFYLLKIIESLHSKVDSIKNKGVRTNEPSMREVFTEDNPEREHYRKTTEELFLKSNLSCLDFIEKLQPKL